MRSVFLPGGSAGRRGFTLIELLIVSAIIAVLAAIAVPNFLEAQVRSKVARTHADLRSISNALESYRVDWNAYPPVGNPLLPSSSDLYVPLERRLLPVTTPVAYLSALPRDPFFREGVPGLAGGSSHYVYAPGNLYAGGAALYSGTQYRNTIYSVSGRGPDGVILYGGYCMAHPTAYQNKANIEGLYDPTNGTISAGDIWRLGAGSLGSR